MSESLRNDGRIWVPSKLGESRSPADIPEEDRDYYLERRYPSFGNLAPRDISSRAAKERIDAGYGVGAMKNAVYLDFKDAILKQGLAEVKKKYGNLFDMYQKITGVNAYEQPMLISPAAHFSMGGLWVDYELSTTIPGLFAIGEANFSDHGANRLGANSLLQACVDGYYILPYTLPHYLAGLRIEEKTLSTDLPAFELAEREIRNEVQRLTSIKGSRTVDDFHRSLGKILYDYCGLSRTESGLKTAMQKINDLKDAFYQDVRIPGSSDQMNDELEKASRVADYLEIARQMCEDALTRDESCGAHFREEFQTPEGEAERNDLEYAFVSCWQYGKEGSQLIREPLQFDYVKPTERSYK
jgi:succinate dehydrogenase / fumarate reductase flavoprotein subunit